MTFELNRGLTTELFTRQDLANILHALEPTHVRTGFDHGWMEALCRVGLACGIRYNAPTPPQAPRELGGPA